MAAGTTEEAVTGAETTAFGAAAVGVGLLDYFEFFDVLLMMVGCTFSPFATALRGARTPSGTILAVISLRPARRTPGRRLVEKEPPVNIFKFLVTVGEDYKI